MNVRKVRCVSSCLAAAGLVVSAAVQAAETAPPTKGRPVPKAGKVVNVKPRLADTRVDTEKYPDGTVKKVTPWVDGRIHGDVKEFWSGGTQLKSLVHYVRGSREGNAETYFENGRLETLTPYKSDRIEGTFERHDNPGAVRDQYGQVFQPILVEQVPYAGGEKEGVARTWRRVNAANSGVLSTESAYKGGKLHGESITYGPGDTSRTIKRYKYGLQDGLEERFFATGKTEVNWKDGEQHGLSRVLLSRYGSWPEKEEEWNNGALVWRKKYEYFLLGGSTKVKSVQAYNAASKLHGKSEFWREADKREKTLEFANGLQDGIAEYYDESGTKVVRREEWKDGAKVRDLPAAIRRGRE